MNHPIIFLDIDGVLNTDMMCTAHPSALHPKLMKRLANLITATSSHLVISSTWRRDLNYLEVLYEHLQKVGLDKDEIIKGFTPVFSSLDNTRKPGEKREALRIREIASYLSSNPTTSPMVVIDDLDLKEVEEVTNAKFIKSNPESGLSERNVEEAVLHLRGE
ncbi:hypothetical protein TrRE_jg6374 [Triparma retinervis]|uniref:Uncharacterized protein n=1 Tax=Triparma retinervis TaxID=2557542 RepID=A0A9W7G4Z6_9STRA|nr:hypothetical protein TrRE_jg6374 [Triparma retinervis]